MIRLSCALVVSVLLSACSTSRMFDEFHGIFLTRIQEDNTKSFVYTSPDRGAARGQIRHSAMQSRRHSGQNQQQAYRAREQLEKRLFQALEQEIATTGYCRDGYIHLGSYIERGLFEIRGECNDTATDNDRAKFQ